MRIKIYIAFAVVAALAAVAGTVFAAAGPLPGILAGLAAAVLAGAYAARSIADNIDKTAAGIRELGGGQAERIIWDDPAMMGPVDAALADADKRFMEVVADLTGDKHTRDLILNNMRDGVILTDSATKILLVNPAACKIFKLSQSELVGKSLVRAIPSQELNELLKKVIDGAREAEDDIETFMPRERHLRAVAMPVGNEMGMTGVLAVIHDITGKYRINAVRRDFVANVSHELKTPISGINLLADSILTALEKDPQEARAFGNKLKKETKRLSQLIRDLLDLSQLEAEKMRPVSTQISLSEIAKDVVSEMAEAAAEGGISLRTELKPDLPLITGSDSQLRLMVRNLIDNAINYTPKGGDVLVKTSSADSRVSLTVKDTGIGIPKDDRQRIFERFYRVDPNRSSETGGTGLGLSIVKHVIDNHEGKIEVESTIGLGSKFIVRLEPPGGDRS